VKPLEDLVEFGVEAEVLRAEIAERRAFLKKHPQGLLSHYDKDTTARIAALNVELVMLEAKLQWQEVLKPTYDAGFEAAAEDEKRKRARAAKRHWLKSRNYCVKHATAKWAAYPRRRIGEVSQELLEELILNRLKAPNKPDTVAEWLREAAKTGALVIPPEAQRPGRPKTS
jgi:hypothetical protein